MRIRSRLHHGKTLAAAIAISLAIPVISAHGALAASTLDEADPGAPPGNFSEINLGSDRTAQNFFYRIPAMAHLGNGVIIAAWDARPGSAADAPNPNSIVQRKSTDNGATWGAMTTIAAGFPGSADEGKYGYSDPSYVVDEEVGKVFAFFVYSKDQGFHGSTWGHDDGNRQVISAAVVESTDDGATWSKPRLITDVVKPGDHAVPGAVRSTFATSGQGIQLTRGEYAGRLVQQYAGDVMQADGSRAIQAYSVYSDDHGATWQRGEFTGKAMDENKVVELSDGRLLLNSRDNSGGGYRKVAISSDGGHSYSSVTQDRNLPDPTNNAHITQMFPDAEINSSQAKKLLYTGANSQASRSNVSARISCDDGKTWPGLRTIRRGLSAYSVAGALDGGKFGVFYEAGYTDSMQFASFDEEWLNYVCAPMQASTFKADAGTTVDVPVTITNQEAQTISGTIDIGASNLFNAAATQVTDLASGQSTTVNVPITIAATALGVQSLQLQFTSASGSTSQATIAAQVAGQEVTGIEVVGQRGDASRDLAADPYAVGEKVPYSFRVSNIGNINQWVVPAEGNFSPFAAKPVGESSPAGNCRYSNLGADKSYTCATPRHEVTDQEIADGYFVPQTRWTSGRIGEYTSVVDEYTVTGEEVDLLDRQPAFSVEVSQPAVADRPGNSSSRAGAWVNFEVTVTNTGNVRLTDLEGPGFSVVELAAGQSRTATISRLLTSLEISEGKLTKGSLLATASNGHREVEAEYSLAEVKLAER
ncbi:exo-alpha-sialidase [Glutamicibacter sp. NPDC127525]|uniref:exo-alpha-sialidase n=1 Tax=unclassified Glutamicibacter TaxID=2627139 RepID=UPI00362794AF